MSDGKKGSVYIVDGHSYAYRAFYGLPPMTAPDGREVHAIYGFYNMIKRVIREKKPFAIAIVFDHPKPTKKHEMFAGYKAQREKMPESLGEQIEYLKKTSAAYGFSVFEKEGYEADDIIASAACFAEEAGFKSVILTSDKDMMQLVNENISILKFGKKEEIILTPETIEERFGIKPSQVADLLALMGDASDNIPGVKGIGEKTAYKLIKEYGSVGGILKTLDSLKPDKTAALIKAGMEDMTLSLKLAKLTVDNELAANMGFSPEKASAANVDFAGLNAELQKLGFKSMLFDAPGAAAGIPSKTAESTAKASACDLQGVFKGLEQNDVIALFFDKNGNEEVVYGGVKGDCRYCVYQGGSLPGWLSSKKIITNSSGRIFKSLKTAGPHLVSDLMLKSYLLDPERPFKEISGVMTRHAGELFYSLEDAAGKGAKKTGISETNSGELGKVFGAITDHASAVSDRLDAALKEKGLDKIYDEMEIPLSAVLAKMEARGLKIDLKFLGELSEKTQAELSKLEALIYKKTGAEFNINSPKQLGEVLFDTLGLPAEKKNKTGYSTDSEVLSNLEAMHPAVPLILRYRMLAKLKGGFIDAISEYASKEGFIYPVYNQAVTSTGRLSSSNPNIQNIPVRGEEGRELRKIFIPHQAAGIMLKADYSQIELRILAHFSGDKKLISAFKEGRDIHTEAAKEIFGLTEDFLSKDHRRVAKTINFGIIYGISAFGLSKQLKVSNHEASGYIERFFQTFPGVRDYQESLIEAARKNGCVETLYGRKRFMADINSRNRTIREFAERAAVNAPIQGTAADIIKNAMIEIDALIERDYKEVMMILQVHDELVFSLPKRQLNRFKKEAVEVMKNAARLDVPVEVTAGEGANWNECG